MRKKNKGIVVGVVVLIVSAVVYFFFRKDIAEIVNVREARKLADS
jgi:hypothetical protein